MTRDEFIDGYMQRSKIDPKYRTATGFDTPGWPRIALPCACGDPSCNGWAMVTDSPEGISGQMFYAPEDEQRKYLASLPAELLTGDDPSDSPTARVMEVNYKIIKKLNDEYDITRKGE